MEGSWHKLMAAPWGDMSEAAKVAKLNAQREFHNSLVKFWASPERGKFRRLDGSIPQVGSK